jgi:hypothetical protein
MNEGIFDVRMDLAELKTVYRVLSSSPLADIREKQLLNRIEKLVTQNVSIEEFEELSRGVK